MKHQSSWQSITKHAWQTKRFTRTSKLEIKPHGKPNCFAKESVLNGLILFQGDQVRHRVRPMQKGEERLVINLLFTTDPTHTKNPLLKGYQALVNYFFYGKLQTSFTKNAQPQGEQNDWTIFMRQKCLDYWRRFGNGKRDCQATGKIRRKRCLGCF